MAKRAWIVEPELIDRFLNMLTKNGFKWVSGCRANKFNPAFENDTLVFLEKSPKKIGYMRYSFYLNHPDGEYNITEVTDELLREMESEGVSSTIVPDGSVNHPAHYNHGGVETITIIEMLLTEEEYRGYLKGNVLKYRERAPYKGNAEQDYAKAKWYFDELLRIGF